MFAKEYVMSSNMLKAAWFVFLICLHFSHGSDPQPEQIHLSSTGKKRKVVKLKRNGNYKRHVIILDSGTKILLQRNSATTLIKGKFKLKGLLNSKITSLTKWNI